VSHMNTTLAILLAQSLSNLDPEQKRSCPSYGCTSCETLHCSCTQLVSQCTRKIRRLVRRMRALPSRRPYSGTARRLSMDSLRAIRREERFVADPRCSSADKLLYFLRVRGAARCWEGGLSAVEILFVDRCFW
jgi:hypothetical protein